MDKNIVVARGRIVRALKNAGINIVSSRTYHSEGVEVDARDLVGAVVINPVATSDRNAVQTRSEKRALMTVQIVKTLRDLGMSPMMRERPMVNDREFSDLDLCAVFVKINPSFGENYQKVWDESIEAFMVNRIAKKAREERKNITEELERKRAEKAKRDAEEQRQLAAARAANPFILPNTIILNQEDHRVAVYTVHGNGCDIVLTIDAKRRRSIWEDGNFEWYCSVGYLKIYADGRTDGLSSTSADGPTIDDVVMAFAAYRGEF